MPVVRAWCAAGRLCSVAIVGLAMAFGIPFKQAIAVDLIPIIAILPMLGNEVAAGPRGGSNAWTSHFPCAVQAFATLGAVASINAVVRIRMRHVFK